jgi:AAHS family 4-hydroxybenzoate transporter-like MFS transporter
MLALQLGCNALSGLVYPTYVRGSGVGWGLGMTRLGQMVSAVCGGLLLDLGLSPAQLFGILAVTLLLGAIAGYALHRKLVQHRILDPEARTGDRPIQLKEARNEA